MTARSLTDTFYATPNPVNAINLAIGDHKAFTHNHPSWDYIDQLAIAKRMVEAYPQLVEFAKRVKRARDYYADYGRYPPEYGIEGDICFDDWAADIAQTILTMIREY